MAEAAALETGHKQPTRITVIDYDEMNFGEREALPMDELAAFREDIDHYVGECPRSLGDAPSIDQARRDFRPAPADRGGYPDTAQRPKLEDMVDYVFLSVKQFCRREKSGRYPVEQVSIVIGKRFVLTFEEGNDGPFEPVR